MEHSSSSALLHLSHRFYLCAYHDSVYIIFDIIKPEPQLKRGLCLFPIMCGYMELFCLRAASGLPLEICFSKKLCDITWGLGRVRTNATPFDRRKPLDHLGTWSSLNQSRLLIGLRPQNHLGAWSNPNHCHAF